MGSSMIISASCRTDISCVDASLFGVSAPRDKNQREGCNCAVSVDIGAYNPRA